MWLVGSLIVIIIYAGEKDVMRAFLLLVCFFLSLCTYSLNLFFPNRKLQCVCFIALLWTRTQCIESSSNLDDPVFENHPPAPQET